MDGGVDPQLRTVSLVAAVDRIKCPGPGGLDEARIDVAGNDRESIVSELAANRFARRSPPGLLVPRLGGTETRSTATGHRGILDR